MVELTHEGRSVAIGMPFELPAPAVEPGLLRYENVLTDVDLVVSFTATGISEVLEVKNREAAMNPALASLLLSFSGSGIELAVDEASGVTARAGGSPVFVSGDAVMWDSRVYPELGPAPSAVSRSERVQPVGLHQKPASVPVGKSSAMGVEVVPDAEGLTGPEVVYPVFIDPTVEFGMNERLVLWSYGGREWGAEAAELKVGNCGWPGCVMGNVARSYFMLSLGEGQGPGGSPLPAGGKMATIHSTALTITQLWNAATWETPVYLRNAGAFSSGTAWGGPLGDVRATASTAYRTPTSVTFSGPGLDEYVRLAVNPDVYWPVLAFALTSPNEGDAYQWKKFAPDAKLRVVFSFPVDAPTLTGVGVWNSCANGWATTSTRPLLKAQAVSLSPQAVNVEYVLQRADGTAVATQTVTGVAPNTVASWQAPALADGSYRWQARTVVPAGGGVGQLVSPWSAWQGFSVRTVAQVGAGSVTLGYEAANPPTRFDSTATVRLSATGAYGFQYHWGSSPTMPILPTTGACQPQSLGTPDGVVSATNGVATLQIPASLFSDVADPLTGLPTRTLYVKPLDINGLGGGSAQIVTKTIQLAGDAQVAAKTEATVKTSGVVVVNAAGFSGGGYVDRSTAGQIAVDAKALYASATWALKLAVVGSPTCHQVSVSIDGVPLTDGIDDSGMPAPLTLACNTPTRTVLTHTLADVTLSPTSVVTLSGDGQFGVDYAWAGQINQAIKAKWLSYRLGAGETLGHPVSGVTCGLSGGGCIMSFPASRDIITSSVGTHVILGGIGQTYRSAGRENSVYGYPVSDETQRPNGAYQEYRKIGSSVRTRIAWSPTYGTFGVHCTGVLATWAANGYQDGRYGYPTGWPVINGASCSQSFQGGTLSGAV